MKRILLAAALFVPAFLPLSAIAAPRSACVPVVKEAWIRLMPGDMPMQAGYGRFENPCRVAVDIVGATSPVHGRVTLHQSSVSGGMSRMRAMGTLHLAPGAKAAFEPGGSHIMLMEARRTLAAGSTLPLTFKLADGRSFTVDFAVRDPDL